jgi:integrase/recombinase XerD
MPAKKSYPGYLEPRGSTFRVTFTVHGKRHKIRLETEDRAEAESLARAEYDKLVASVGRTGDPVRRVRMSELLDAFETGALPDRAKNTARTYLRSLAVFRAYFVNEIGDPTVERVGRGRIRSFLEWRKARDNVSGRTLAKDRATLSAVFAYGNERELCDGNPVTATAVPKSDPRTPIIIDNAGLEALLSACECDEDGRELREAPMLRLYVLVLAETGVRCDSEALHLRWADVDLEGGFLLIRSGREHRTKGGRSRHVPMTTRLHRAMREHVLRFRGARYAGKTSPWVFHHEHTRRHAKAGERVGNFRRSFEGAVLRAKLDPELHQHDLRHRRVTAWLAEGASPMLVRVAMGHSDIRTTQGYSHLVKEHLRSLVGGAPDGDVGDILGTQAGKTG